MKNRILLSVILLAICEISLYAQQIADTNYRPFIPRPEYPIGKGPVVALDEGHNNFHTVSGRYLPFTRLLVSDGYVVNGYKGEFTESQLRKVRILVIANALNKINTDAWYLPTPSAFTATEIETVLKWVEKGGSLFLIADHMPFGGAAADLASAFGFTFTNGFAADTSNFSDAYFYRKDKTLISCSITNGRNAEERVDEVVTFTGQAFRIPSDATPILKFNDNYLLLENDTAWVFDSHTRYTKIKDWSQGAYMKFGKGRVAMFAEAAMFSAQLSGQQQKKVGMNSEYAKENYNLLLNIIHWLEGKME